MVLGTISVAAMYWPTSFARLSAVVSFLASLVLSVLLMWSLSSRQASRSFVSGAIAVETLLMLGAYWAFTHLPIAGTEVFVVLLSLALGLQNGAVRRAGALSVHTTYLTGMITGLLVAEAERIHFRASSQATSDPSMRVVGGIWLLFFVGAAVGAALADHFNAAGILCPAGSGYPGHHQCADGSALHQRAERPDIAHLYECPFIEASFAGVWRNDRHHRRGSGCEDHQTGDRSPHEFACEVLSERGRALRGRTRAPDCKEHGGEYAHGKNRTHSQNHESHTLGLV